MRCLRVKRWLASMKRKRKEHRKVDCFYQNSPAIENDILAGTMSSLGKPLERLPTQFVKDCGYIPVVLTNAAFVIERSIKTKGVFQTQGNLSKVNVSLNHLMAPRLSKNKNDNVHDVVEAMKAFLLRLPEPLLPESVCDALISISQGEDSPSQYLAVLTKYRNSSPHTFAILHYLMLLLKRISEYSEYNSMDVRKLATVFVLDVIKPLKLENNNEGLFIIERMQRLPYLIMVVENLISQVEIFKMVNSATHLHPSPRESVVSLGKSNNWISPSSSQINIEDLNEPLTLSKVSRQENVTVLSSKSRESEESKHSKRDKSGNRANEEFVSKTFNFTSTRAKSEPRKDGTSHPDIAKRCLTTVPVSAEDVVSKEAEFSGETSKSAKAGNVVYPAEVSLELEDPVVEYESKNKKVTLNRTLSFKSKKSRPTASKTLSPTIKKKSSGKKEQVDVLLTTMDAKPHKISDPQPVTNQEKKKLKFHPAIKKPKRVSEICASDRNTRGYDFSSFKPDEEITPWREGSANSDDTSIMAKTIRNPRVLAYTVAAAEHPNRQSELPYVQKNRTRLISSEKVTQMFLAQYGFRTISRQNNLAAKAVRSDSSISSGSSYVRSALTPAPEICNQWSSSEETTPISKELIRGVKVKESIGVNTSPYFETSATISKTDDTHKILEISKEYPRPPSSASCAKGNMSFCLKSSQTATKICNVSNPNTDVQSELKIQRDIPVSKVNSPQPTRLQVVSHSANPPPVRLDRLGQHVRFRQHQIRKALKSSSCLLEQKSANKRSKNVQFQSMFLREWFVDIVLGCITLLCISVAFLFHEYMKVRDVWNL